MYTIILKEHILTCIIVQYYTHYQPHLLYTEKSNHRYILL